MTSPQSSSPPHNPATETARESGQEAAQQGGGAFQVLGYGAAGRLGVAGQDRLGDRGVLARGVVDGKLDRSPAGGDSAFGG